MFELTFLGTAASTPSAERGLPALLVGAGGQRFLVDCGEGTQRQILRAGTGFRRLGHVLLTHAHLDHVLGLAGLVATLGLLEVRGELAICGSAETVEFIERYLSALWPQRQAPVPLRFVALEPGPVLEGRGFRIGCFPVRHRGTESLGFRFTHVPPPGQLLVPVLQLTPPQLAPGVEPPTQRFASVSPARKMFEPSGRL